MLWTTLLRFGSPITRPIRFTVGRAVSNCGRRPNVGRCVGLATNAVPSANRRGASLSVFAEPSAPVAGCRVSVAHNDNHDCKNDNDGGAGRYGGNHTAAKLEAAEEDAQRKATSARTAGLRIGSGRKQSTLMGLT